MYRLLSADSASKERRNQLRHPNYQKPELLATGPNQVWSWDISVPQKRRERWEFGLPQSACRSRLQTTMSGCS